jgi:hypothetical protein
VKKTLKNLLYGVPLAFALSLPMNNANAQTKETNDSTRIEINEKQRIERPHALSLGIQSVDGGISFGYSRKIPSRSGKHTFGVYGFLSKGKYRSPVDFYLKENYEDSYVDHYKIALGGMIHTKEDNSGLSAFLSLGPSYSFFNKKHDISKTIDKKLLANFSLEGGAGVIFNGWIGIGDSYDPLRPENNVYLKIQFGYHQNVPKTPKIKPVAGWRKKTWTSPALFF